MPFFKEASQAFIIVGPSAKGSEKGICSSTGSACSERNLAPSYVLTAIGLTHQEANGSLRLTLSRFTTDEEIEYALKVLPGIISKLRLISPFGAV